MKDLKGSNKSLIPKKETIMLIFPFIRQNNAILISEKSSSIARKKDIANSTLEGGLLLTLVSVSTTRKIR